MKTNARVALVLKEESYWEGGMSEWGSNEGSYYAKRVLSRAGFLLVTFGLVAGTGELRRRKFRRGGSSQEV